MDRLSFYIPRPINFSELRPVDSSDLANVTDISIRKYEICRDREADIVLKKILHDIYELQYKGYEPQNIIVGKKIYEGALAYNYCYSKEINFDTLFGIRVSLDGSDNSYNYKVLTDNRNELMHRHNTR